MNISKHNKSACERNALTVILALNNFQACLLLLQTFKIITEYQALPRMFMK